MVPKDSDSSSEKSRYLFKITVVGPEDAILEKVLNLFGSNVVALDGIRIGASGMETEDTDVRTLIMSPQHSALDILLSMTYKGANGAIIVLREADPVVEAKYRDIIREKVGKTVPTRVVIVESKLTKAKRAEICSLFEEIVLEILESRTR